MVLILKDDGREEREREREREHEYWQTLLKLASCENNKRMWQQNEYSFTMGGKTPIVQILLCLPLSAL